jgi:general secretion pathway protein A
MYLDHYQLNRKPFEMSPDPRFLWMGEKHKEALAALEYGILESKGFLLLTGDAGTGKTVLINALLKSTRVKAIIATIPDPDLDILDFFNVLAEEFQMNRTFETKGSFLIEFKRFLYDVYQSEGKVLLIIDESQRLNHELLDQIRILSNIELNDRKLINIFFVGQSEFNQILREERNAAVRKRLAVSYNLEPLDHKETEQYIDHRLKIAGAVENLFTPEAVRSIFYFSGGLPRLINITCDHALLIGYSKGLNRIDGRMIAECRRDLKILSDTPASEPEDNRSESVDNRSEPEDYRFEDNGEIDEFNEPPDIKQGGKSVWFYAILILVFMVIAYFIFNFGWRNVSGVGIKETLISLKNVFSEKDSLKAKEIIEVEVDNEKVPENDQHQTTAAQENLDEAGTNTVLPAAQGENEMVDATPPEDFLSLVQQKTIVQFAHDSMKLTDQAREVLDPIARFGASQPVSKIIVEGYTDSRGDYVYNKNLSRSRAEVVKKYLVEKGIPETKIEAVGRGPENPIASNDTFEGRKRNRRIEISVKVN